MPRKKKTIKNISIKLSSAKIPKSNESGFFLTAIIPPWNIKSSDPDFSIKEFKQLLSLEKSRILHVIKAKKPKSIYSVAKELGRDFKAVRQDIKLLEQFELVRLIPENDKKTGRNRLRPVLELDKLNVSIEF